MTAFIIGMVVLSFILCLQMCAVLYKDIKKIQDAQEVLFNSLGSLGHMISELHDRIRVLEDKIKDKKYGIHKKN